MSNVPIHSHMKEVSEDEFFRVLYADPRDIMPNHEIPTFTTWRTKDRIVWGWSYPGWRNPGEPKRWAIAVGEVKGGA